MPAATAMSTYVTVSSELGAQASSIGHSTCTGSTAVNCGCVEGGKQGYTEGNVGRGEWSSGE